MRIRYSSTSPAFVRDCARVGLPNVIMSLPTPSFNSLTCFRRASGAHRIDGVGKPLALALHALLAGNLTFAGGIERSAANLDLTLSLVMADDQATWRDAGPSQLERMRRRAVGEQLFAAAKHDRHREDAHSVDQVIGEQRVDEFGTALADEVRAILLLQALHVGDVAQEH